MEKLRLSRRKLRDMHGRGIGWFWLCEGWGSVGSGSSVRDAIDDWWLTLRCLYCIRPWAYLAWRACVGAKSFVSKKNPEDR